ncbi:four helix bundle protein [Patescibacteria group bacterium]|nr:four helix bundle protein [Patescibacteria group bacterium]
MDNEQPNYEKLEIWQEAVELITQIYQATKRFPQEEKFGIIDQLRRAMVSVALNIAEGQGRGTKTEFRRFLYIALGSLNEAATLLVISVKLRMLSQEEGNELRYHLLILMRRTKSLITNL